VTISGRTFRYERRWSGRRLLPIDGYLAFDTETDVVDLKRQVPRLALASASAGEQDSCLLHPLDVPRFVLAHRTLHIICHNAAFDFWVVEQHLRSLGAEEALHAWWDLAERNRLHDSMLLDMLVRLARDDSYPDPRDLAAVARDYAGLQISKDDPYRKRYGEIIGKDWDDVEEGFFTYGVKDAVVTRPAYLAIRRQALALADEYARHGGDVLPDARQKFGLLTEAVQVKKAIALAAVTRNGMAVDLDGVRRKEADLRAAIAEAAAAAQAVCPVYKVDDRGEIITSGKSNTPALDDKAVRARLAAIKEEVERETGLPVKVPDTTRGISRSVKLWAEYADRHPFLSIWIREQNLAKLLQFFNEFQDHVRVADLASALGVDPDELAAALGVAPGDDDPPALPAPALAGKVAKRARQLGNLGLEPAHVRDVIDALAEAGRRPLGEVHPSYTTLVRTGRTSCSGPNVQQIPRDSAFRQAFVARPGHLLMVADYSFIELRTLAAATLNRYGWSRMADVIKAGVDPHVHTAALMLGVPVAEFASWKNNEAVAAAGSATDGPGAAVKYKDRYERARQQAKPVNFGVPGGLGVASLVSYARQTYKVALTQEEARERRERLVKEVYPELDLYLAEDGVAVVAQNLKAPLWEARAELGDLHLGCLQKVLAGDPKRVDGKPYQRTFVARIWSSLAGLARDPELKAALQKRESSVTLAARVCYSAVATLTGRIRGRVRYSQARNTPFQGLAADGAALALFALVKEGFRVVGFVHDEVLVELPDEGGYVSEDKVRRVTDILCAGMEAVLTGGIPVGCEFAVSRKWHKKAKPVVRDGKVFAWEPKPETGQPA
jgi:hypothetical protein